MKQTAASVKKLHYAWIVMIGCGIMLVGTQGLFAILAGNFFVPVTDDLGFSISSLAAYMTFLSIALALTLFLVGNILSKVNTRILLPGMAAAEILAFGLMSVYTEPWMWYVSGIVIGIGMAFTSSVTLSTILTNWFNKKSGMAIGCAWGISSVVLACLSPVVPIVIEMIGWRGAYVAMAIIAACFALPSTVFLIRFKPADMGLEPYGYDPNESDKESASNENGSGVAARNVLRSSSFVLVIMAGGIFTLTTFLNGLLPTYANSVGLSATVGSLMISAAMIADVVLNPLVGFTCDKVGAIKAVFVWTLVSMASYVMLECTAQSAGLSILAAAVNDVPYALLGVGMASIVREMYGAKDFGKIFAFIIGISSLIGCFGTWLLSTIFEISGGFTAVFVYCIASDIVFLILLIFARRSSKKLPVETA
ncbi:MFS transporter [Eggerthella sp. YY7918]|uniref:MFS transporter n=1 Tax=Eggerthella sp. (strain YY7918) TaxID=502558 RepID=UPI00021710A6|nr:MFS transporter [Eggerthella sp. YY7918]BAK43467.1 hypothetical protein EGYY_02310 [Eggerthella sp. YY7918]